MLLFYGMDIGFEESGPPEGWVKKCPVDTFLARGRIPSPADASSRDVDAGETTFRTPILSDGVLFMG